DDHDENYRKHLEFAQLNIARMAASAFLYKSWMIALVSGLFAVYAVSLNKKVLLVALIPAISCWVLDAFHLGTERNFRELYDLIRTKKRSNFEMNPTPLPLSEWVAAFASKTF